jgi:DNA-directed RNA polymerase subunit F
MTKSGPPKTSEDLVRAVADLFDEVEPETQEEIDAVLREAGHDPDEVAARMKVVAERALASSPFNWRNRAQRELADERARYERLASVLPRSRADILSAIQALLAQLGGRTQQAYAHFRNFESATDEDLARLLSELEYLASQQHGQHRKGEK